MFIRSNKVRLKFKVASTDVEVGGADNLGAQTEAEQGPDQTTKNPASKTDPKTSGKIDDILFEEEMDPTRVNPGRNRYPFCIVWTPIPLIT